MTKTQVVQINEIAERVKDIQVSEVDEEIYRIVFALKQERKKQKISQKQLSSLTDLPQNTISRIETFVSTPSLGVLIKMAKALNLQIAWQKTDSY